MKQKVYTFLAIVPALLVVDWVTKRWALEALASGRQIQVIPGFLPFTLAFNRGAAFGLEIGDDPRLVFIPITLLALVLLTSLYVKAERGDWLRLVSLALVIGGALGNLYDRVRWERGVVDFIGPANLGFADFPIFNVADMGISCGAVLLAISFWLEERKALAAAAPAEPAAATPLEEP
ncbi:MAG: signal peptidase II [Gemmatimonadota bacterium]|nr:signal peptidase II [Gemmatimonadota bacterium]